jgi:hypothetical protein
VHKSDVVNFPEGSAARVIAHAAYSYSRGRKPSMMFFGEKNPQKAIAITATFFNDGVLPMGEASRRLRELAVEKQSQQPHIAEILTYLAARLKVALLPEGVYNLIEMTLWDFEHVIDGMKNTPIYGSAVGQMPMIYALWRLELRQLVPTVFPAEFAAAMRMHIEHVDAFVATKRAEEKAALPAETPLTEEEQRTTFAAAKTIVEFIRSYRNDEPGYERPWHEPEINAFYGQSSHGLYVEMYYSGPGYLYTPWGKVSFGLSGIGRADDYWTDAFQKLGATVHQAVKHTAQGTIGPIYALHTLPDGTALPEPQLRNRLQYMKYEDGKQVWERFKAESDAQLTPA